MDHGVVTRRSIDILLAENFLDPGNSQAHAYCEHWNREILGPNRNARESRIGIFIKMGHVTHTFKTQAKHRQRGFRATWPIKLYLSMSLSYFFIFL